MFNLDKIGLLLDELDALTFRIEGIKSEPDANPSQAKTDKAEISRMLLRASDVAGAAEAEFRLLYWQFKGFPDPREGADS